MTTLIDKVKTLVEYAKFGMQIVKLCLAEDTELVLPKPIKYLWTTDPLSHLMKNSHTTGIKSQYVTEIHNGAFRDNKHIRKLILPNCKKMSGYGCIGMTLNEIDFSSLETMSGLDFHNNTVTCAVEFPKLKSIGQRDFENTKAPSIYIPLLEVVGDRSFLYCQCPLIMLPSAKTLVGVCFNNCTMLEKLTLGIVTSMSQQALNGSQNITCIEIAKGTTGTLYLQPAINLTQESLHKIIENYADMTYKNAPTLYIGSTNIAKIDDEHIVMLENKNINYQ